jgi:tetratricopeptide (TPR) repeat protein
MRYKKIAFVFILLFSCALFLKAEVSLEEVIQAGRFVFYRDHADPHKYYYVPDEPRLATKRDGTPEFTFIKYSKIGGDIKGGVVHFLVTWGLRESEILTAESSLQMLDPEAKVVGPVPFKAGTFKIISATAGEGGLFNVKICGEGNAPIMPGQKGAVSIALTQEGASLLWESFKNPTTDISVMFMLKYNGITPAYEAKLKVDWDKVYTHHDVSVSAGGEISKTIKLQADLKAIFDDLKQKGAIQLEVTGESKNMEKLLEATYGHLTKLMCNTSIKTDEQIKKSKTTSTRRTRRRRIAMNELPSIQSYSESSFSLGALVDQFNPFQTHRTLFAGLGSPWAMGKMFVSQDQQQSNEKVQKAEKLKDEGDNLKTSGEYSKAIGKYLESYMNSLDPEIQGLIAEVYDKHLQDAGNALDYYKKYLDEGKRKNVFKGREDRQNSIQERITRLEESIEHFNKGVELIKNKSYGDALIEFEQSQQIAPYYLNLEYTGICLENLGQKDLSLENYRKLLEYIKKYPEQFTETDIEQRIERKINSLGSEGNAQPRSGDQTDNVREGQNADKGSQANNQDKGKSSQEKTQGAKSDDSKEKSKDPGKQSASAPKTTGQPQSGTQQRSTRRTSRRRPTVSKKTPEVKPPFNLKVSYTFKRVKMSGHYEVDLRHRIREERIMVMSGNIGGLYQQYGEDKSFFSTVSLDDPVFQERTIEVILDGQNFEDFKNYINSVSVMFKKERWGKPATTGEVKFFDEQFAEKGNRLTFIYGREGEGSTEWLNYEFKPKWSFYGGIEWEGDWIKTADSMITLNPVVYYRSVQIAMDKDNIEENGIKAVAFQIKHQIFGKDILKEVIIDHEKGDPLEAEYRYLHEDGKLDYQYKIIWLLKDGREIHSDWMEKETPIIYAYYSE